MDNINILCIERNKFDTISKGLVNYLSEVLPINNKNIIINRGSIERLFMLHKDLQYKQELNIIYQYLQVINYNYISILL